MLAKMVTCLSKMFVKFDTPQRINLPSKQRLILIGNHRSMFDCAAVFALSSKFDFSARLMVHDSFFQKGMLGPLLLRSIGAIPTSRARRQEAEADAVKALLQGSPLAIMPEGRLVEEEVWRRKYVDRFQLGFSRVAAQTDAFIVPIALLGCESFWPRENTFPNFQLGRRTIHIRVGEAFRLPSDEDHVRNASFAETKLSELIRQTEEELDSSEAEKQNKAYSVVQ